MARKRISHYLLLIAAMIVLNFFLPRMIPGSPVARLAGDSVETMNVEERDRILEFYNLDKPLFEQFLIFLKNTFTLNWGKSYSKKLPIFTLFKNALPWTLLLAVSNIVLSGVIGTVLGAVSAFKRKNGKDKLLVFSILAFSSIPAFWIGMMLFSVFGVQLRLFPMYGAYSMWSDNTGMAFVVDVLHHLALPLATTVIASVTSFFTTARYGVLRTIGQDYIKMARMRGVPARRINVFYVMRNAIIPVLTVMMSRMGFILGGSLVVERLFSYPGLGLLMSDAVASKDYPLMQYSFLMTSVMVVVTTFLADLMHRKLDPSVEVSYEK